MTNAEIAVELHVSLSTVKTHLADDQAKLDARNRVEIAARAWKAARPPSGRAPRAAGPAGVSGAGSVAERREAAAQPPRRRPTVPARAPVPPRPSPSPPPPSASPCAPSPQASMSASPTTEAGRARGLRKGPRRRLRPPGHGRTRRSPRRTPHRGPQPRRGLGRHRRPTPVTDAVSQADMPRDLHARATYSRQP